LHLDEFNCNFRINYPAIRSNKRKTHKTQLLLTKYFTFDNYRNLVFYIVGMGIDKQLGLGLGRPIVVPDTVGSCGTCSPVVAAGQAATTEAVNAVLDTTWLNENEIDPEAKVRFKSLLQAFAILGLSEGTDFTHSILTVPLNRNKADRYSVFKIGKYNTTILVCRNKKALTYIVRRIVEDRELPIKRSKFRPDGTESDGHIALQLTSVSLQAWRICEIVSGGEVTYFTDLRKVRSEIKAFARSIDLPEDDFGISISKAERARAMTEYGEEISFLAYLKRYRKSLGKNADELDDQALIDSLLLSVGLLSRDKVRKIIEVYNGGMPPGDLMLDDVDLDPGLYGEA